MAGGAAGGIEGGARRAAAARRRSRCTSGGVGFFPNPHSPRVFWCGIEAPGLAELAADTDRATAALGIESEKRAFSPHLTLARIKEKLEPAAAARDHRGAARRSISAASRPRSFYLYQSKSRPTGSVYTKLAEFPLSKSMIALLVLLIAYLLGAIPFGYLLVQWKTGGDVRASGSGNIGATNVLRTSGRAGRHRHPAAGYRQGLSGGLDRRQTDRRRIRFG